MSFLADILVHTGMFLGFLPLFFFLYVAPTQANALTDDFFNMLVPYINGLSSVFRGMTASQFQTGLQDIKVAAEGKLSEFSESVSATNKKLKTYVAIVVGILSPLLIIIGFVIEYFSGGNLVHFLISNLIVLAFIAISEFAIVGLFVKNFVEIDPQFIYASYEQQIDYSGYESCWYTNRFIRSILPQWLANKILEYTPPPE